VNNRSRVLQALGLLFRLVVTALASFVILRRFGASRMIEIAWRADLPWLAAAMVLASIQVVLSAKRWQILCELFIRSRPSLWRMIHLSGQSLLFGQLLPSSVGQDVIRAGALARDGGLLAAARSVICDRLVGLLALLLIVAATLPLFALKAGETSALAGLAAVSFGGLAAFGMLALSPGWFARLPLVGHGLAVASADFHSALTIRGVGLGTVMLSIAVHLLGVGLFAAIVRGIHADISPFDCLVILPAAVLAASIPISLGGWGVREAVIASGFALIGADAAGGATASILYGLTSPLCGLIAEMLGLLIRPGPMQRTTG